MFPRLHDDAKCPLDGYEGYTFRVLLNPTGAEKEDWFAGSLGTTNCEDCAEIRQDETHPRPYCAACMTARERFGRAAAAIFGRSQVAGFDFSGPDAALATFEQSDLPDEFLAWLYWLPAALWSARVDDLKKKLSGPSATAS